MGQKLVQGHRDYETKGSLSKILLDFDNDPAYHQYVCDGTIGTWQLPTESSGQMTRHHVLFALLSVTLAICPLAMKPIAPAEIEVSRCAITYWMPWSLVRIQPGPQVCTVLNQNSLLSVEGRLF
jgi:hypothetical protein